MAILGPSGANLHGTDEYVEVESVLSLVKIMVLTAVDFCGLAQEGHARALRASARYCAG
jgi:hypothetical protein